MEILYIGSKHGIEKKMIEKIGIAYKGVYCGKLRRYFSFQNFVDAFKVPMGILQARRILKRFKPDVVFSKGGFVGLPVVIAASWLGLPIITHESDVLVGLANKIALKRASKICVSFEETKAKIGSEYLEKVVVTGNPVRKSILHGDKERGYKFTGLDKYRPVILVMGGSQGAEQINELVRAGLDDLLKKFQIVHVRGRGNLDISLKRKGYVQYEYLDEEMRDVYAMSEMVISRGGANSLAEIAALKKKTLIIPLGTNVSRGDQIENTKVFARELGWGVLSGEISSDQFVDSVEMSYKNDLAANYDFRNGVDEIVDLIKLYE